ncbi:MAG TPA: peptidoglycan DD-metalloendopeptidase family protein, partial [Burkholderiales bacterium]|nr:peptidoglycan DD-metalloendopeptidase family protein [Burkholderiales bacterium]
MFYAITPAWSATSTTNAAGAKEELQQLRARIEALQKKLAGAEESRNEAADALRESERAISEANRELAELDQSSRVVTQRTEALRGESRKTNETLESHQNDFARLLHVQHVQHGGSSPDALRLVLNGENPNDIARDLHYLGYVSRARGDAIRGMRESLSQLKSLRDEAAAKAAELAAIGAAQLNQRKRLETEKRKRAEVVGRLSRDITRQRQEIGAMRRNESRLTTLIEQLARVITRPPPAPRDKAATPRQRHERNESVPEPTTLTQAFSKLRGTLALPVRGELAGRFGSPRSDGGTTWKGLFLAAKSGEAVKAVAAGRVVYADWLRGFGNLLIVDHGEGYMSLYGYNETLLKRVGDEIHSGDTVATVGDSGGSADSGLYFELRHQGKPFDPLSWV